MHGYARVRDILKPHCLVYAAAEPGRIVGDPDSIIAVLRRLKFSDDNDGEYLAPHPLNRMCVTVDENEVNIRFFDADVFHEDLPLKVPVFKKFQVMLQGLMHLHVDISKRNERLGVVTDKDITEIKDGLRRCGVNTDRSNINVQIDDADGMQYFLEDGSNRRFE